MPQSFVSIVFAIEMKREGDFSGFLPRQKKSKEGGGRGTKLKPGPNQGQNKFKCVSFYSKTKTF